MTWDQVGEAPGRERGVFRGSGEPRGTCLLADGRAEDGCALSEAGLLVLEEHDFLPQHGEGRPGHGQRSPCPGPGRRATVSRLLTLRSGAGPRRPLRRASLWQGLRWESPLQSQRPQAPPQQRGSLACPRPRRPQSPLVGTRRGQTKAAAAKSEAYGGVGVRNRGPGPSRVLPTTSHSLLVPVSAGGPFPGREAH